MEYKRKNVDKCETWEEQAQKLVQAAKEAGYEAQAHPEGYSVGEAYKKAKEASK